MRSRCAASTGPRAPPPRRGNVVSFEAVPRFKPRGCGRRLHARAAGQFPCRNLDFQSQVSLAQLSSAPVSAANVWGFVDLNDNREYAVLGSAQRHRDRRGHGSRESARGDHDCRQPVAVARGEGLPSVRRRRESLARVRVRATEAANSGVQIDRPVGAADDGGACVDEHGHGLAAHAVRLEHRLCDERRVAGLDPRALCGRQQLERRLVARLQPRESRVSAVPEQRADDALHARLDEPRRHGRAGGAMRAGPRSVRGARRLQRRSQVELWDVTNKPQPVLLGTATNPNNRYIHSGWPTANASHLIFHDELEEIQLGLLDADLHAESRRICARPPCS